MVTANVRDSKELLDSASKTGQSEIDTSIQYPQCLNPFISHLEAAPTTSASKPEVLGTLRELSSAAKI